MKSLVKKKDEINNSEEGATLTDNDSLVSFLSEVPPSLKEAMVTFIEDHPNWDQYRLIQAALAGFLVQNGVDSRPINRLYCQNMFSKKAFGKKT